MSQHKVLVLAFMGEDKKAVRRAMIQVMKDCIVDGMDPRTLPIMEFEYLFLQIRARSVGETVYISLEDPKSKKAKRLEINLLDVKPSIDEDRKYKVDLVDTNGKPTGQFFIMREPTVVAQLEVLSLIDDDKEINQDIETAVRCVSMVCDSESQVSASELDQQKEIREYVEGMTPKQYESIDGFLRGIPVLKHEVELSTVFPGRKGVYTLEGLEAFFG